MSFEAMAVVWRVRLPATVKVVMLAYADYARPKTHECFPSAREVSQHANVDRSDVWRIRQAMDKHGVLVAGPGGKTVFNVAWLPTEDGRKAFINACRRGRETHLIVLGVSQQNVGSVPTKSVLGHPQQGVGSVPHNVGSVPHNVGSVPIEAKEAKEAKGSRRREKPSASPSAPSAAAPRRMSTAQMTESDNPHVQAWIDTFQVGITQTNAAIVADKASGLSVADWKAGCEFWAGATTKAGTPYNLHNFEGIVETAQRLAVAKRQGSPKARPNHAQAVTDDEIAAAEAVARLELEGVR